MIRKSGQKSLHSRVLSWSREKNLLYKYMQDQNEKKVELSYIIQNKRVPAKASPLKNIQTICRNIIKQSNSKVMTDYKES